MTPTIGEGESLEHQDECERGAANETQRSADQPRQLPEPFTERDEEISGKEQHEECIDQRREVCEGVSPVEADDPVEDNGDEHPKHASPPKNQQDDNRQLDDDDRECDGATPEG